MLHLGSSSTANNQLSLTAIILLLTSERLPMSEAIPIQKELWNYYQTQMFDLNDKTLVVLLFHWLTQPQILQ